MKTNYKGYEVEGTAKEIKQLIEGKEQKKKRKFTKAHREAISKAVKKAKKKR